ncbi:MAG: TRAP transporter large permease [Deltaproteobacteria bacterium]|nr:TRAP transporter large permease [Deltaproteobacteria bacterium]
MEPWFGVWGFVALLVLLALGVPVAFAMAGVGLAGFALLSNWQAGIAAFSIVAYSNTAHFVLACIPLFILMGQFAFRSGITEELYDVMHKWFGSVPGGLGIATVFASAGLGAVTGSSVAAVATLGEIALPELERHRYDPTFAVGTIAAAGTLGILIPPSIPMVLYGLLAEESIGRLFVGGIIPGLLTAMIFSGLIYFRAVRHPNMAPSGATSSWRERFRAPWRVWGVTLLFLLVIGGMFLGWFTPTEGAGIGAAGALGILAAVRKLDRYVLGEALGQAIRLTAMIVAILLGASMFTQFISITGLTVSFADWVISLPANRYVILTAILVVYLILGCMMDVIGMLVLTVPVFFPVITKLGFDGVWFGIVVTVMIEVSLITPPVGTNVIIIKRVSGLPSRQVFAGVAWFVVMEMVVVSLLVLFPALATWLPDRMLN